MEKEEGKVSTVDFLEKVGIESEGKSSAYIVTFTPFFKNTSRREMEALDSSYKVEKVISDCISLVSSEHMYDEFTHNIVENTPIFIKHIMPVMDAGKIEGNLEEDKKLLLERVKDIAKIEKGGKFAVQCRVISGSLPYSAKDIEVYIGEDYYNNGYVPSFSDREIRNEDIDIISILLHEKDFYVGVSKSNENLNFHSDEHRIGSRTGREISRAENKLKEALSTFKVELKGGGIALDLGAAPGGWSKVLADYGYKVLAVDPANLDDRLENDPRIVHIRSKSQDLKLEEPLDLIVNDMNMDPQDTAEIMNELAPLLAEGGLAILTLKLPSSPKRSVQEAVDILKLRYDVKKVRSLSHNRQEVTALLQKKR